MSDTMTTLQLGLKTDFRDHLQNTISLKAFLIKRIESAGRTYDVGGRGGEAVWGVEQEYGYGLGGHAEGGDLKTAYADLFENYIVPLPRFNIALEFTTDALAYTRKSSTKFFTENILRRKIKVVRNIAQHFLATGCHMNGDGVYGTIGVAAAGGGTGDFNGATMTIREPGVIWMRPGMRIMFENQAALGTAIDNSGVGWRIVAVDRVASTITLTADPSLTNTLDYNVYLIDRFGVSEMNGLGNLVSATGTVGGINRATAGNEFAQSWVLDAGGTDLLHEVHFDTLNDYIRDFAPNKDVVTEFVASSRDCRELFLALVERHRFNGSDKLVAGKPTLFVNTSDGPRPLHSDPYAVPGDIKAICPSEFVMLWPEGEKGGDWLDEDGSILKLKTASSGQGRAAAYQGYWEMRPQMFIDDFQAQGVLTNYAYSSGSNRPASNYPANPGIA